MFRVTPNQKQINKYFGTSQNEIKIPNTWVDFARMVSVRSGGEIVKFDPYNYQIKLVELMLQRSVIVTKSRQLGISETITCFMLWRACLNCGYLGVVFSKTQVDTGLLARRMKRMINSLGLKTTTENLGDIEIEGKGRILFKNSNPDSARGIESVVDCFFDEFAFVEDAKFIYDAVAPAQQMLGNKARVFAVSTPNGKAGFYWDLLSNGNGDKDVEMLCSQVSKGESEPFQYWIDSGGWGKVLIHWKEHPIYGSNPNFLQEVHKKQKLSWETINQEYNLSFQESETNYFNADIIRQCAIGVNEKSKPKTIYFIGVDTATVGLDYCVAVVLKYNDEDESFSLVNMYRKRQETSEYHLFHIGKLIEDYEPVAVGIEVTGGTGVIYLENLSKSYALTSKFHAVKTTGDTKPAMLDRLKLYMEQSKFIYSENSPIVDELLSFKRQEKKLQAAQGKHDDVLMASCFALTIAEESGIL